MLFKRIFLLICLVMYSTLQAQVENKVIELDTIAVKANTPEKTIYQAQKVDAITQQSNIGKDLAHQLEILPGVQVRKSGSNISKPIIDGLSSSRLVYMVNGVKLENQDWADAHAPEIDADLAESLSVIRGVETVKYGSNALGGVVDINAGNIPKNHKLNGEAHIHYIGNTAGWGGLLKLQQNSNLIKGLRWRLMANNIQNGDYKTAEYNVGNSGTRLQSYHATLDYKLKNLEVNSFYSFYQSKQGNYFGTLTGNIEEFEDRIEAGRPLVILPYSFKIRPPYQQSKHQMVNTSVKWKFKPRWHIYAQYAYQQNRKEEFDVRRNAINALPVQNMTLTSHHWKGEIGFNNHALQSIVGVQLRDKENYNVPGTGVVPALPNYVFKEKSIYTYHTYNLDRWILNGGIRYDWAKSNARGINFISQLYGEDKDFSALSAQLATTYTQHQWNLKSSLSYGWRVPESYELYANGKQHGIPIYFVGDADLDAEKSLKWMNTFQFKTKHTQTELQGFVNILENYIYAVPSGEFKQLFSGPAAIFQFKQKDALIVGADLIQKTDITPQIELINKLSWLQGKEKNSHWHLPNIAPLRWYNSLQITLPEIGNLEHNVFKIIHDWVGKKKHYNPAYELSRQVPNAYHLINLAMSSTYAIEKNHEITWILGVDNLFNTLYKDYLNLHRYFVHDRGRSFNIHIQYKF